MNSPRPALRGRQTPRVESIPAWSTTAGDDAIDVATVGGRDVFPWQQYVVRNGMAKSDRLTMSGVRRWAAYEVAVLVARQNGKNGCIEVVELGWMINEPGVSILHTAHKFSTAMESMEKLETLIRSHPLIEAELLPGKKGVVRSHGFESIKFKNGSIIRFKTRTNMGARGFSVDRLIFDEAMDLSPASIKSLTPLLTTADNPQIWYLASAADVTDQAYCHKWASLRKRALKGADPALCWMEWSTTEPPELTSHEELLAWCEDRERWEESNPSLGYLLDEEYIENELAGMADQLPGFLVERLSVGNWPTDLAATPEYVIKPDDWSARTDPKPILRNDSAIGMDVSPDGLTCTIAAATFRDDGGSHLELIYHGKSARVRQKDGTLRGPVDMAIAIWLKEKPRAVVIDRQSPAFAFVPDLEAAGVKVIVTNASQMGQACSAIDNELPDGLISHTGDQLMLDALKSASKRPIGTGGAWGWDRRGDFVITPMVAVTLARFGLWAEVEEPQPDSTYEETDFIML
ncbi:hypothetical protein [Rhodococcus sp. IEGM 1318]|uniref:hypothetical protein n=1 Tax=Rhodococcus sp. IEGM 1318 TaxID=3082226 RepID=UPI0029533C20|nr:hypothetical protein [Rhodococcus sp. IEGM 1318]MDV8005036.1 hypothetical protein [Rhodococcus sp. IEGM 1318]